MKEIQLKKSHLEGEIILPPSKSISHRAIICASLTEGDKSVIDNIVLSEDIKATIDCCEKLGAIISYDERKKQLTVIGKNNIDSKSSKKFYCKESGSTLRFIIPIAAVMFNTTIYEASEGLARRPLDTYYEIFDENNIRYETSDGKLPLKIYDRLDADVFYLDGSISSQFISGIMLASPLLKKDVKIILKNELESKNYIDITLQVMKEFGIDIESKIIDGRYEFFIRKNQHYFAIKFLVEADCSQAAFWATGNYLGADIVFDEIIDSYQGDVKIFEHLDALNICRNRYLHDGVKSEYIIDAKNIPDIIPILALASAVTNGVKVYIVNAARLRIKECDRLMATYRIIKDLGGEIYQEEESLIIVGKRQLAGGISLDSYNDHRMAMMIAIAATVCEDSLILANFQAVKKSYPEFWNDYAKLSGNMVYL